MVDRILRAELQLARSRAPAREVLPYSLQVNVTISQSPQHPLSDPDGIGSVLHSEKRRRLCPSRFVKNLAAPLRHSTNCMVLARLPAFRQQEAFERHAAPLGQFQRQLQPWLPLPPLDHREQGIRNPQLVGDVHHPNVPVRPEVGVKVRIHAPWHDQNISQNTKSRQAKSVGIAKLFSRFRK